MMFNFLTCHSFVQDMEALLPNVFAWQVRNMPLAQRIAAIQNYECYLLLQAQSKRMGMQASDAEIVSWLDNIVIIRRLLNYLKTSELVDCAIGLEVALPTQKKIDVLLYRGSKMMIIESCYQQPNSNSLDVENRQQVDSYQKILQFHHLDLLQVDSLIINILPEYDATGKILDEEAKNKNEELLASIAVRIRTFFFSK